MDPRRLRHFPALVEERSFTRAAAREYIVQSGLSASIRSLEADIGVELYIRGSRPVRLTAEGAALVPAARHALDALAGTYEAVSGVSGRLSGHLRMGVFQSVDHLVPVSAVLARLLTDHPAIELRLRQLSSKEMTRMVAAGELDCAIVSATPARTNGVEITALAEEPFDLVVPVTHPLARRPGVDLADLDGVAFVDTPPGFTSRTLTDRAFAAAGVDRRVVCEAGDWSMIVDLITAGLGIGLVPRGIVARVAADPARNLTTVEVTDLTITRRIDLALPRAEAAGPVTRELARRLDHAASDHARVHARRSDPDEAER